MSKKMIECLFALLVPLSFIGLGMYAGHSDVGIVLVMLGVLGSLGVIVGGYLYIHVGEHTWEEK